MSLLGPGGLAAALPLGDLRLGGIWSYWIGGVGAMVVICGGGEKISRNIFSFDSATPSVLLWGWSR